MNSLGNLFKVQIFGESHGPLVGVIIDGCPAGLEIKTEDFLYCSQVLKHNIYYCIKETLHTISLNVYFSKNVV
jgi:hypothetical protein